MCSTISELCLLIGGVNAILEEVNTVSSSIISSNSSPFG